MRRASFLVLFFLTMFSGGGNMVFALSEPAIRTKVTSVKNQADADLDAAVTGYTCGGLLPMDARVLAYYQRRPSFECILTEWCSMYDKTSGACIGKKCVLHHWNQRGVPQTTLLFDCAGGTCPATPPSPHESCDFRYFASRARHYECGHWSGPAFVTDAQAECYTYLPHLRYERSYYPFAYNCSLRYLTGGPVSPSDPKGEPNLIPPHETRPALRESVGPWEPAQGSSLTVPSLPGERPAPDSSITPLSLDVARVSAEQSVVYSTVGVPARLTDYPDLSTLLSRLMNPPEVRLILPRGGLSLAHDRSNLFSRIFESLRMPETPSPVLRALGNNPDALLLAADYLEHIPLTEVRYVPLEVLAPFASTLTLKELAEEWRTWLAHTQDLAAAAGLSVDAVVVSTVQSNIEVLGSYIALQDSLREYRLHFPRYLHALLSNIEANNRFFHEEWAAVNAQRLREWHTAYTHYLGTTSAPGLRKRLRALYDKAAQFTETCLVPACRLDAIPVAAGAKPWDLIPEGSDLVFTGPNAAFLPEMPRLWENYYGQVLQRHPTELIGSPLPDLTLDFSEVYLRRVITVPVLKVEWQPLRLPYPPPLDPQNLSLSLQSLKEIITPLPRLHPPLPRLTFPAIVLPDPSKSLLLVPEAPRVLLGVVDQALTWLEDRLTKLSDPSFCNTSGSPQTFLVHEFLLYGGRINTQTARAAALVPWGTQGFFDPARVTGMGVGRVTALPGGMQPSRLPLSPCPGCGMARPQRYLRQHIELDEEWGVMQEHFLRSIDEWNAQVRYFSVIPRNELETLASPPTKRKSLLQLLLSPL